MIIGIGTDILEIARIKRACRSARFIEKYFTVSERKLFSEKHPETAAGNFCCKEAAVKALGCGFDGFFPDCVEVVRDSRGAPVIIFHGKAKEIADSLGVVKIHASITHCDEYAAAFVVLEG